VFCVSSSVLKEISNALTRTISALWKNRKLSPEQQLELVANVEKKYPELERHADDSDCFTGMEEAKMSHVCSFDIPLTVSGTSITCILTALKSTVNLTKFIKNARDF